MTRQKIRAAALGAVACMGGVHAIASANPTAGAEILRDPGTNRGLGFPQALRHSKAVSGLVPPAERSFDDQDACALAHLRRKEAPLDKFEFLEGLHSTDERTYFSLLVKHTAECMPIVYTPTVGAACQNWSGMQHGMGPKGMYISIKDKGRVKEMLQNWPRDEVKAIVVTDGERILGLGDLGANGMGIPIGKLSLYTACAGVDPAVCMPVTLDTGTNTKSVLDDKFYIGNRHERVRGPEYDEFIDEFFRACKELYGEQVLIQFEDFGNLNAFRLLEKYQPDYCTFNDDIQGTASVVVAGLLASVRITGIPISQQTFLFQGAGEAGVGIAELIAEAIKTEGGVSIEEARGQIWLMDSQGLVHGGRSGLAHHKLPFAHPIPAGMSDTTDPEAKILEALDAVQPHALIGVSAQGGCFTEAVLKKMAELHKQPVILALSNPTHKAECTAREAYEHTDGAAIFASGSPFDPVTLADGRSFVPGQGNNAYVFPGIGLAALASGAKHLTDSDMFVAANCLASLVDQARLDQGCLYPPLEDIREVSAEIAAAVAANIHERGDATLPRPDDLVAHCKSLMYEPTVA